MSDELWFRFHPSKFMAGIRGLNANEVKVYICVLCRIYERGEAVKNDAEILATYCEMRVSSFEKALARLVRLEKLILTDDGRLTNALAEEEISRRASYSENARRAGKKSAEKRQQNQSPSPTDAQRAVNQEDKDKEKKEKETPNGVSKKKGSRISADWRLPKEWGDWAVEAGLDEVAVRREADKFRDYWIGKAGREGVKLDWLATWRNWVRRALQDRPARPMVSRVTDGDVRIRNGQREVFAVGAGWVPEWS